VLRMRSLQAQTFFLGELANQTVGRVVDAPLTRVQCRCGEIAVRRKARLEELLDLELAHGPVNVEVVAAQRGAALLNTKTRK